MLALAALVCTALAVIFILPRWQAGRQTVSMPTATIPANTTAAAATSPAPAPAPARAADAATEAERQAARSAAQDLLEQIRELDKNLKAIAVETWAAADYQSAAGQLAAAEHAYQSLDYPVARAGYQAALEQFEALMQKSDTVFAESMARGKQALIDGNSSAAGAAFQTALLIRPDDADARKGAERAGKIDHVMALIRTGEERAHAGELAAAAAAYQQARDLDPDSALAQERLQSARRELGALAYRAAMSAGFAALDAGQPGAARGHFTEALRLQPGAPEAADALRQTETRLTSTEIEQHLANARAAEQSEDWSRAVTEYEAALKLDPNLQAASAGISAASARRDLDQQLAQAIARPERLADENVDAETTALLARAANVPSPGAKLKQQMAVLSALQQESRTPVAVTLISDGATEVTVYRVGRLGRFTSKEMSLRPGHYVVTGARSGYRDVRVEFAVTTTGAGAPVQVQCTQPIGTVN
jgi:tetratricopeptide (TPR) repeat protein